MLVISNQDIYIPQGEPGSFDIQYTSEPPEDGTKILFSVKQYEDDKDALIEKTMAVEDGKITVDLMSEDTDLEPGRYKWDLVEENGYRPIVPAWFIIGKVVGNKGAVMI